MNGLMGKKKQLLDALDPVWERIQIEAKAAVKKEPILGGSLHACILHHRSIEQALAYKVACKLASQEMSEQFIREICDDAYKNDEELSLAGRADIVAVYQRDPACNSYLQPIFFF